MLELVSGTARPNDATPPVGLLAGDAWQGSVLASAFQCGESRVPVAPAQRGVIMTFQWVLFTLYLLPASFMLPFLVSH